MRVHLEHITLLRASRAGEPREPILQTGRKYLPINFFNTLQLRPFEKRIKTDKRSRRELHTTELIKKKNRKYDFESLMLIEHRNL